MCKGCKYCKEEKDLLIGETEELNDLIFFAKKDVDTLSIRDIKKSFNEVRIRVFYDRGYLRITKGDDVGCLDHSEDKIEISYCPMCGRKLNKIGILEEDAEVIFYDNDRYDIMYKPPREYEK